MFLPSASPLPSLYWCLYNKSAMGENDFCLRTLFMDCQYDLQPFNSGLDFGCLTVMLVHCIFLSVGEPNFP